MAKKSKAKSRKSGKGHSVGSNPATPGSTTSEFGHIDIHSAERLADQRTIQDHVQRLKKSPTINEKRRLLSEIAFYPKHAKRTESPEYKKVHHDLVVTKDLPCLVCGVQNSTLNDPKRNSYGAKQMETHHHVIEWALANAIDVGKFNRIMRPNLAHKHPNNPDYQKQMSQQQVVDWVDHSSDNLWVLCDVHHRAKFFGIHEITYPIWCPMDLLEPDFDDYVHRELKAEAAKDKKSKGGKKGAAKKSKKSKKSKGKSKKRAKS